MGTPGPDTVSTKRQRIAMLARQMPGVALTSLSHHIDMDWMKEAFQRTRKGGAPGVDGQTAQEYEAALESFWQQMMAMGGGWVVEVDIRKFFDTLDHSHLQALVGQRVRDGVLLRLIGKWLNAGVMEEGTLAYPEAGTPQGGVISPLLANVYLHEVLDMWFEQDVKPRLHGRAFLVRFADDFVIGFTQEADARRVLDILPKRFEKYGLALHPEKTRLVRFKPPRRRAEGGTDEPESFDLLGFTHHWARSLRGQWVVRRRTAKGRFRRAMKAVAEWCRAHRHRPIREQHRALSQKLKGHYGYYGITGNAAALQRFLFRVRRTWHKWLARRSNRSMTWERFSRLEAVFPLPRAIAIHSVRRRVAKSVS